MSLSLPDIVGLRAEDHPEHVALVVDGAHCLGLGEWLDRARAVAHGLVDRGVRPGDRVALFTDDSGWLDYAVGNLAIYLAGGTVVGMSSQVPAPELRRRFEHCGAVGVVHAGSVAPPPVGGWAATVDGLDSGRKDPPGVPLDAAALAEILYTSGTTGAPKPVSVSHANLTFGRDPRGQLFGDGDSILAAVAAGTNAGHSAMLLALMTRTTVHVLTALDPHYVAAMIDKQRVRMAILPPPIATRIVAGGLAQTHDLSGVATFMLGSAPGGWGWVGVVWRAVPDAKLLIGYGSTESAPAFVSKPIPPWHEHNDPDLYERPDMTALGRPGGDSEVMIADPDGRPLPPGEVGEICLRSPAPARSYFGDPAATARVFRDGWTRMGDLGHLDGDGNVHFFDRAGDVITSGGRRISSARVEDALYRHPQVVDAAAFAVPDGRAGEVVAAAVELRRPTSDDDALPTGDELRAFVAERLDATEVPHRVHVLDELPHGAIGKVLKRRLRERYAVSP